MEFVINQTNPTINEQSVLDPNRFEEWFKYGRGPLTLPVTDGLGYIKSPSGNEIELIFIPLGRNPDTFMITTLLLQPDARGNVTLRSKNPFHQPIMSFNYYDSKTDLENNIYGLKYSVKLVEETQAFKDVAARLNPVPFSKCDHILFKSDDYWACLSKHLTHSYQHQCGTCRMGDVVNDKLQVIGIQGLRVIDSSVFPYIPHAHLYAPTLMVGEKGADLVKSSWS